MTASELQETIRVLGWSSRELGRRAGYSHNVSHAWLNDNRPIPESISIWLSSLRAAVESVPVPRRCT